MCLKHLRVGKNTIAVWRKFCFLLRTDFDELFVRDLSPLETGLRKQLPLGKGIDPSLGSTRHQKWGENLVFRMRTKLEKQGKVFKVEREAGERPTQSSRS